MWKEHCLNFYCLFQVGKPVTFSVDATQAGEGTLELVISTEQSTVKAEVVACSRGLYDVTFVPHQLAPHFVNITFNEEDVPGQFVLYNVKLCFRYQIVIVIVMLFVGHKLKNLESTNRL